ncbi:MAG: hypothetical protein ACK4S2_07100 [Gemmobacter sp.]
MSDQLDLFSWAALPPPPEWQRWRNHPRYGFRQYWPCACGRTHSGIVLSYPWSPLVSLRHWRISEAHA